MQRYVSFENELVFTASLLNRLQSVDCQSQTTLLSVERCAGMEYPEDFIVLEKVGEG